MSVCVCACVCVSSQLKRNSSYGLLLKCCQTYHSTSFLCVFVSAVEGSVLHHCRIRADFGPLGVDIWLKPCQSIGWLSGIDHCAERPTCLFVFHSAGLCRMYGATEQHHRTSTLWLCGCFYMLFHSLSSRRYYVFMSAFLYLFFWTWCYFYSSSALLFMPVCDSPPVTHC